MYIYTHKSNIKALSLYEADVFSLNIYGKFPIHVFKMKSQDEQSTVLFLKSDFELFAGNSLVSPSSAMQER